jgi:hypothetical protein
VTVAAALEEARLGTVVLVEVVALSVGVGPGEDSTDSGGRVGDDACDGSAGDQRFPKGWLSGSPARTPPDPEPSRAGRS